MTSLPVKLLTVDVANEQAADVSRFVHVCQRQGEPPRTMIPIPSAPLAEGEHARNAVRRAFWQAHYCGRPSHGVERGLALWRLAASDLPPELGPQLLMRSLR